MDLPNRPYAQGLKGLNLLDAPRLQARSCQFF